MTSPVKPSTNELLADRYECIRELGTGGMGVVWEALDRSRNVHVALKLLRSAGPETLLLFKNEFRALAGISHPNLVSLYELNTAAEEPFFTMELLEGCDFRSWVLEVVDHPSVRPETLATETASHIDIAPVATLDIDARMALGRYVGAPGEPARLRAALEQLARGLFALHEMGKLHRDVKPSNVMVGPDGRVVLLDFGVITELAGDTSPTEGRIVGTPAFMAPEQAILESAPSAASDWYAVGLMLYEALTGHMPFGGNVGTTLYRRIHLDPVRVERINPSAPQDLVKLCHDLLARAPRDRPSGREVLERLGVSVDVADQNLSHSVGRARELARLRAMVERARAGKGSAALIGGTSGFGKSTLAQDVLSPLEHDGSSLVLRGRCYERETVPYKALDPLVDHLAQVLARRPAAQVAAVLPADLSPLVRVFPALRRVEEIERRTARAAEQEDPADASQQRRAFDSLVKLFLALARDQLLVLYIDDLQWGDAESAAVLMELLRAHDAHLLMVACYRTEEIERSELLAQILGAGSGPHLEHIVLGPLSEQDIVQLAEEELRGTSIPRELSARVAREAGGSPFFARELIRYARSVGGNADGSSMSLDQVIRARADRLSDAARELIDIVAISGGRTPWRIVEHARGQATDPQALVELIAQQFVSATGISPGDSVECFHDRVRESLAGAIDAPRARTLHLRLAESLEEHGDLEGDDLYRLVAHYLAAAPEDRQRRVYETAFEAGRRAAATFSYEQAHRHLVAAETAADKANIALGPAFHQLFGDVSARTGQMELAISHLREALAGSKQPVERADLRFRIAMVHYGQLHIEDALSDIDAGLSEVGLHSPRGTPLDALRSAGAWLLTLLGSWLGLLREEKNEQRRRRLGVVLRLYQAFMTVAYFQMLPIPQLQAALLSLRPVKKLGPGRHRMEWSSLAALLAAILHKRRLSERLRQKAMALAEASQDPVAHAFARHMAAHGPHFLGDTAGGEKVLGEALREEGQWLENGDFLTAIAAFAWNTMMRGRAREAVDAVEQGLARAALDDSLLTEGHTYRCYAGPSMAMLGRDEEGGRHLSEFRAHMDATPPDRWRTAQWAAHYLLFSAEIGERAPEVEEAVTRFDALGLHAKRVPLVIRHYYVALARWALTDIADGVPDAMAKLDRALGLLRACASHPTLEAHLRMLEARRAVVRQEPARAEQALDAALALAESSDNDWIRWEALLVRARLAPEAEATRLRSKARAFATDRGWSRHRVEAADAVGRLFG